MHDPYAILEVSRSATPAEIKAAYRKLAHDYHPDKIPGHLARLRVDAEEKLKLINAAYETLSDPATRRAYDDAALSTEAAWRTFVNMGLRATVLRRTTSTLMLGYPTRKAAQAAEKDKAVLEQALRSMTGRKIAVSIEHREPVEKKPPPHRERAQVDTFTAWEQFKQRAQHEAPETFSRLCAGVSVLGATQGTLSLLFPEDRPAEITTADKRRIERGLFDVSGRKILVSLKGRNRN